MGRDVGDGHEHNMTGEAHYHIEANADTRNKETPDGKTEAPKGQISKTTVFVLMLAFGIHELFEGVAFGMLEEVATALQLAIGIIIHKTCAAISLGAGFTKAGFSLMQIIVLILLFSLSTPIGIVIGMSVDGMSKLVTSVFFALSAGTFIYVACTEIITHEFEHQNWSGLKFLMVLLGGCVIGALWFLTPEDGHNH